MSPKPGSEISTTTSQSTIVEAAARTIANIYEKANLLQKHPRLGRRYELERTREIRILLYEHYRITYLIKATGDIDILGVFHGALDIDRYFI